MFDNKTKSAPKDYRFLYLDMNSFFASCEQQNNPKYQNKPIAVAPFYGPTGTIVAASFEAKKFGIKTGMKVGEALTLSPELIIVEANAALYRETNQKIATIIGQFTPWFTIKSIDELVISLSPSEQSANKAYHLALAIKEALRIQLGPYLTCSVGIGPNVFLAKQASNLTKKDGFNIIKLDQMDKFYQRVDLDSLTGIGQGMLTRLGQIGIYTSTQFFQAKEGYLRQKLGLNGEYWALRLHGHSIDNNKVGVAKSLSHSHVLSPDQRNWTVSKKILQSLVNKCGDRLRKNRLMSQSISLSISFLNNQPKWQRQIKTKPIQDNTGLYKIVEKVWQERPKEYPPYKIAIWTNNLISQSAIQLDLFETNNKTHNLGRMIDLINQSSNKKIIYPASLIKDKDLAPDRISFGNTR